MPKWINKLFAAEAPVEPTPKPGTEKTEGQSGSGFGLGDFDLFEEKSSIIKKVPRMRANSTIALARAVAQAPIRSVKITAKSKDEVPKERKQQVQNAIEPLLKELIRNMLFGVDYGYKPFEVVWGMPIYAPGLLAPVKIKPLNISKTKPITDKKTGQYLGLKQDKVVLDAQYTFWYTHDKEDDNYLGRSRLLNCERDYDQWERLTERQSQYVNMVASPIPLVEYPPGQSKDASGIDTPHYEIAQRIINSIAHGRGIYMPNDMVRWARELIERGADPGKLKAWMISFIEAKGNHGGDFVEQLRHRESGMMRGYIVPERTAMEGQFGTKAEAVVHTNVALQMCDLTILELLTHINWYLIDRILLFNFGPEAVGSIWLEHQPLVDEQNIILKNMFMQVLSNNPNYLRAWIDVDRSLDKLGLPKAAESVADAIIEEDKPANKEAITAAIGKMMGTD